MVAGNTIGTQPFNPATSAAGYNPGTTPVVDKARDLVSPTGDSVMGENGVDDGKDGTTDGVEESIAMAREAAVQRRKESVLFSTAMQQIAQDTEHIRKGLEQSGKAIFAETRTG